ncbi:hypothetical protein [Selenomonas sp. AE3005]|uniref:hypothetical protein n=1 Tax=Selenomonas sp. AE3005 TaxID=1485543 RepID=UPI0025D07C16|nr:hypothetical protein [Selenomonas sp. AE3005]
MAMYAANPADPRLQQRNEDIVTASTLNGATQVAAEMAGQVPTSLNQRASEIARAEENDAINHELTNRFAQAALWTPVIQNALTQAQPQQQEQPQQESLLLTQGLLPGLGLIQDNTYQARPMYSQEQPAQQAQPETLNQMARRYAQDILDAKQLYAQGEALGGEQGERAMLLAHNGAERARAGLRQLGVDIDAYGLNGSYDEASQAIANNDTRAMQNTLEGEWAESSGSYYDRVYKILRDKGFASDIAENEARRRAQSYASRRVQALNQAFNTYGHNGQVINPMGIQMLGMMAQEDMDMANYYTQRYAGPLQEYAKQNARENAAIQHGYKKEDMALGQQYALDKMGYQAQLNAQLKAVQADLDSKARAQDFQYRVMLLDRQAQLKALTGGGGKGSSGNNVNSAQIKVWQEEVKRADEWDEKHIGQEKDNPYRASANAYKAMIDQSQGLGQGDGKGQYAQYGDVYNDFNAFGKLVDDIYAENGKTGELSNEEIFARLKQINPEFAERYVEEAYRHGVKPSSQSASASDTNAQSNSGGIYDWIVGKLMEKPTLNVKSQDPSRLW